MKKNLSLERFADWNDLPSSVLRLAMAGSLFLGTFINVFGQTSQTQLSGGEAFLQGKYAEVGVRPNGAFGSSSVPTGFHASYPDCLGFRVNRNQVANWGTGTIDDGDFFCPGSPFEGWGLSVNGVRFTNSDSNTDLAGSFSNLVVGNSSTPHSVKWTGNLAFNGITVSQVYSVPETGKVLRMTVTLKNTTGSAINNIRYYRIVDADDATASGDIYTSQNGVISQAPNALVVSTFENQGMALLGLRSVNNANAKVGAFTGDNWYGTSADLLWNGSDWTTTVGSSSLSDNAIGLVVNVGTLASGA